MNDAWLTHEPRDGLAQLAEEHPLDPETRARVEVVLTRLAELRDTFVANLVGATADVAVHVADPVELSGLRERARKRAEQLANARGLTGHLLTLDKPDYDAAERQLDDRAMRKHLFEARFTRASDRGPRAGRFDNGVVLKEMLGLRHELARLLGYRNYAELSLRHDIFQDPDDAEAYLLRSRSDTCKSAQSELDALWAFAKEKGVPRGFSNWDLSYYADWMMREELAFDPESLRPYFPLPAVLAGLWALSERLLGIRVTPSQTYDPRGGAAQFAAVSDAHGTPLGQLVLIACGQAGELLDGPQGCVRCEEGNLPLLRVRAGLAPVCDDELLLLTHAQVEALFRCAGRGLLRLRLAGTSSQSARRRHDNALAAELAGSYLAQFCSDYQSLSGFARHHTSGEVLPPASFEALLAARRRHANLRAARALELTLFDLRIHRDYVPDSENTQLRDQVLDTLIQIRREQGVLPMPYWTRIANTCLPLFAEDEAARLWHQTWAAEVGAHLFSLARDADFSTACLGRLHDTLWVDTDTPLLQRLDETRGKPIELTG